MSFLTTPSLSRRFQLVRSSFMQRDGLPFADVLPEEQIQAVNAVLAEIGAGGKPTIMVLNKLDRLNHDGSGSGNGANGALNRLQENHPHAVAISATTGKGIPALLAEIGTQLRPKREFLELRVPHDQSAVIARLHQVGQVIESSYHGPKARFKVRIPPHYHDEFAPYIARDGQAA